MKILFLGDAGGVCAPIYNFLLADGGGIYFTVGKISTNLAQIIAPDIIISYSYPYILKQDIIALPRLGVINLHISYLPWNRGADPNFWSHLENTPKGVTIHYIDEGIDTGDIIVQKKVRFSKNDTLRTSYSKLHKAIQELFKKYWPKIKSGTAPRENQNGEGSFHLVKHRAEFEFLIAEKGWDTAIKDIKRP